MKSKKQTKKNSPVKRLTLVLITDEFKDLYYRSGKISLCTDIVERHLGYHPDRVHLVLSRKKPIGDDKWKITLVARLGRYYVSTLWGTFAVAPEHYELLRPFGRRFYAKFRVAS